MDLVPERSSNASDRLLAGLLLVLLAAIGLAANGCREIDTSDPFDPDDLPGVSDDGPPAVDRGVVDRVVDGDTIVVDFGTVTERVRLIGIDAPESVAPNQPVHCYGAEASEALHDLLPAGTDVRVERDVEARDRYDRLLLYVYRADDDLFVNHWLVVNGYAESHSYRPNTTHQADFDRARDAARASAIGLWGRCDGPEQPLP